MLSSSRHPSDGPYRPSDFDSRIAFGIDLRGTCIPKRAREKLRHYIAEVWRMTCVRVRVRVRVRLVSILRTRLQVSKVQYSM